MIMIDFTIGQEKKEFQNLLWDIIIKYDKKELYKYLSKYLNNDNNILNIIYQLSCPFYNINKKFIKDDLYHEVTPLIYSSNRGYDMIVNLLLQSNNIDVNIQDNYGWTACVWACIYGHKKIVKLLLQCKNLNVNIQGNLVVNLQLLQRNDLDTQIRQLLEQYQQ